MVFPIYVLSSTINKRKRGKTLHPNLAKPRCPGLIDLTGVEGVFLMCGTALEFAQTNQGSQRRGRLCRGRHPALICRERKGAYSEDATIFCLRLIDEFLRQVC